jgi:hypothetical protein
MKRINSKNEQALQKTAQKPADLKGLQFVKEGMSAAPKTRKGNAIHVAADKTPEQMANELLCEVDKAAGVSLEAAARMSTQMANALVWPKPEGETEGLIKSITMLAEHAPRNIIEAS